MHIWTFVYLSICVFVYLCISMSTVSKLARMNGFPGNMACARPVLPQNNAPLGFQWILWMRWCSNVCHCCKQNQILTHSSVSIQLNNNNSVPCKYFPHIHKYLWTAAFFHQNISTRETKPGAVRGILPLSAAYPLMLVSQMWYVQYLFVYNNNFSNNFLCNIVCTYHTILSSIWNV